MSVSSGAGVSLRLLRTIAPCRKQKGLRNVRRTINEPPNFCPNSFWIIWIARRLKRSEVFSNIKLLIISLIASFASGARFRSSKRVSERLNDLPNQNKMIKKIQAIGWIDRLVLAKLTPRFSCYGHLNQDSWCYLKNSLSSLIDHCLESRPPKIRFVCFIKRSAYSAPRNDDPAIEAPLRIY